MSWSKTNYDRAAPTSYPWGDRSFGTFRSLIARGEVTSTVTPFFSQHENESNPWILLSVFRTTDEFT